ncbi:MAG: hypothetical protein ACREE6_10310 [Limisphaerales bacterium]
MKQRSAARVVLEPKLEAIAALWPPAKRLEMAKMFSRWARQLRVSSFIMTTDARGRVFPRPALPKSSRRKAALN